MCSQKLNISLEEPITDNTALQGDQGRIFWECNKWAEIWKNKSTRWRKGGRGNNLEKSLQTDVVVQMQGQFGLNKEDPIQTYS